jgi:RND family efflux transporter MFP subunit
MKYNSFFIITIALLAACSQPDKKASSEQAAAPVQYQLDTVKAGGVATDRKLPAQLAAYQEVSIFPKVNGYVQSVLVDVGSQVHTGSLLMVLEAPELQEAVAQARERYSRAKADYSIDKEKYDRLMEAARTPGAISPLDISTVKAKMEADSSLSNAERANWQMQQTMLGYLRVTAPFDGVITERNVHPGALVSAATKDKPMLELKQVSHLRLQIDVPEALSARLKQGDTVAFYVSALQGKRMVATISRKSMNMNMQFRTERMELDVSNPDAVLTPGMYADVVLHAEGDTHAMNVPRSAVVTSTERKYVLCSENGKIRKVDVTTGSLSTDRAEIYGAVHPGDIVVIHANDEMKETGK